MNLIAKLIISVLLIIHPLMLSAQCYELIWSDEFEYNGAPDPAKWTHETGAGGWGNNELQYYRADTANVHADSGIMILTARNESYSSSNYTSGRINTRDKFEFQYGRVEASIRLPYGQGIWPAFWILGDDISEVGWPACGEVDIMELVGGDNSDNVVHGTAHWDNNGSHASYGRSYSLTSGIFADTFHIFTAEWSPTYIKWYVDGNLFNTIDIRPSGLSEFHHNFFIILNLAVGGNWPGNPDATTVFPQTMEVDYVRVYQQELNIEIEGDTIVSEKRKEINYSLHLPEHWNYSWNVPEDAKIISGQGTNEITVNWGCLPGEVTCTATGDCGDHPFSTIVTVRNGLSGPMFVDENQQDILFVASDIDSTDYSWSIPADATISEGAGTDSITVSWGSIFSPVSVITENSCGNDTLEMEVLKAGLYPYPDPYTPHAIPGVINATEYDYGGEGVAYHDLTPQNEGPGIRQDESVDTENNDGGKPNVGWITSGEWINYSIRVLEDGYYKFDLRMATNNATGGPFSIDFNEAASLDGIKISATGGWDRFITVDAGTTYLTENDTIMILNFSTGGFNVGDIEITPTEPEGFDPDMTAGEIRVFPNPASEWIRINAPARLASVRFSDPAGRILISKHISGDLSCDLILPSLDTGIYFLTVEKEDGKIATFKILISK